MSEIDRVFNEREARRTQLEQERLARVDAAAGFLAEFFERDIRPSQALARNGIEAHLADNRLLVHRAAAGAYADPLHIVVGEQGEIDVGGRSLGRYALEDKVKMRRELTTEILNFFDL